MSSKTKNNELNNKIMWGYSLKLCVAFAFALVLSMWLIPASADAAAKKPKLECTKQVEFFSGKDLKEFSDKNGYERLFVILNTKKSDKVQVTSSNRKVAVAGGAFFPKTLGYEKNGKFTPLKNYLCRIYVKDYGTTTLTCTVKRGGKTYTSKCKYTLKKYKNPLKSFKIQGESSNYAKYFENTRYCDNPKSDYKAYFDENEDLDESEFTEKARTLKVVAKKGYKIERICFSEEDLEEFAYAKQHSSDSTDSKTIKNGSKIKFSDYHYYDEITIFVKDTKTGDRMKLHMKNVWR